MTEGFGPKIAGFDHFKFGDHKFKKKITKHCSYNDEPIMGREELGNTRLCLKELRKLCDKKILLILDEVQCGISRTGSFFI